MSAFFNIFYGGRWQPSILYYSYDGSVERRKLTLDAFEREVSVKEKRKKVQSIFYYSRKGSFGDCVFMNDAPLNTIELVMEGGGCWLIEKTLLGIQFVYFTEAATFKKEFVKDNKMFDGEYAVDEYNPGKKNFESAINWMRATRQLENPYNVVTANSTHFLVAFLEDMCEAPMKTLEDHINYCHANDSFVNGFKVGMICAGYCCLLLICISKSLFK